MNVGHTLICFFLLTALQDGDAGDVYEGLERGNITVKCSFRVSGRKMFFCRENCEGKNLLIETAGYSAQKGRYSMKYVKNDLLEDDDVYVSIMELKPSDSGVYTCGLERFGPDSKQQFELVVVGAPPTSPPDWTLQPFSPSSAATTESLSSSSASSSSSSSSSETSKQPETSAARPGARPGPNVLLVVGLLLFILLLVLASAVLIFCKRSSSQPKEAAAESDLTKGAQTHQIYEEVSDDRVHVIYSKPKMAESTDEYSLASVPQNKDEDVNYTEVQFPSQSAASLHSASCGRSDVIYSNTCVVGGSVNTTKDASPPLYSAVNFPQK